jgi:hypothetical protein
MIRYYIHWVRALKIIGYHKYSWAYLFNYKFNFFKETQTLTDSIHVS